MAKSDIRDAATVILVRDSTSSPSVLMGQRGASAAFMPNKFVFPGGAVDTTDADVAAGSPLNSVCLDRLGTNRAPALVAAAIRELWEEAGLILGQSGQWHGQQPENWASFAATGHIPHAAPLHYVFRAVTPVGQPRRFDARFFLADACHIAGDPEDFSAACDELSHLQWIPLDQARQFDLPFITEVVLAEISASLPKIGAPDSVPFFNNTDEQSLFERLGGHSPLELTGTKPGSE